MTRKENTFIAKLLRMAANEFSNHGCNDLDSDLEDIFSKEEWIVLMKKYHDYNGDPKEFTGKFESSLLQDWIWMRYFANVLEKEGV